MEKENLFIKNKQLNENEIKTGEIRLTSKPRMLMVVLTTRCNLKCIMCSRKNPSGDVTLPFTAIKQIRELFPYLEAVDWQGGEVFLVDYFKELFLEAGTYPNIDQSIITNGLLIDEQWGKIFGKNKVNITYSVDAVTKDTYEYIRRGAKFEHLLNSLEIISEVNKRCGNPVNLHLNAVIMRSNYKQLNLFPDFCRRYGINHLRFDFLRPDMAPEEDILLKPDIEAIKYLQAELEVIEKESKKLNIWFEYTFRPFLFNLKTDCPMAQFQNTENMSRDNYQAANLKCKLPWKKLYIDACGNGIVRPDCLCKHNLGSIMDSSIEEIWNSETMQLYRQNLVKGSIQDWCSDTCISNAVDTYQLKGSHH